MFELYDEELDFDIFQLEVKQEDPKDSKDQPNV
jgi:hypothetical protein